MKTFLIILAIVVVVFILIEIYNNSKTASLTSTILTLNKTQNVLVHPNGSDCYMGPGLNQKGTWQNDVCQATIPTKPVNILR